MSRSPRQPIPLDGAPAWPDGKPAKHIEDSLRLLARRVPVERYYVAVNVLDGDDERINVLTPFVYTQKRAEELRDQLRLKYPMCAAMSCSCLLDPEDPAHQVVADLYRRRLAGMHGDGVQ